MKQRYFPHLKTLISLLLFSEFAAAAAWDWGSQISITGRSNDNPTLVVGSEGTESLSTTIQGNIVRATSNSNIEITPRISRSYFPDSDFKELENTDIFLGVNSNWTRPRTRFSLNLRFDDESILSSEDRFDDDAGGTSLRADDTRNRISIAPGFTWTISELDRVSINTSFSRTDHELDFTGRADTDYSVLSISYLRSISERQQLGLVAGFSRNDSEQLRLVVDFDNNTGLNFTRPSLNTNETDGANLNLNYVFTVSPELSLNMQVGRQESDTLTKGSAAFLIGTDPTIFLGENCNITPTALDDSGAFIWFEYDNCRRDVSSTQYSFDITRTFAVSKLRFALLQSVFPGATGTPVERVQASVTGDHKFSEKLTGRSRLSIWDQEAITFDNNSTTNRNLRGEFSLDWIVSRNWAVGAEYVFRERERPSSNVDASTITVDSNQFGFYIRYFFEKNPIQQ